ncbi:MAG: virginiamycin B lyase family protein [Candidatus Binatia bacterium]
MRLIRPLAYQLALVAVVAVVVGDSRAYAGWAQVDRFLVNGSTFDITSDGSGGVWVTTSRTAGNSLVHITSTGRRAELAVPETFFYPGDVDVGSDGTVWFVADLFVVARVSPVGELAVLPLDFPSEPVGIAARVGGGAWVTMHESGSVAEIAADGSLGRILNLGTEAWPLGIVSTSDGGAWVADLLNSQIHRIASDGGVSVYSTSSGSRYLAADGQDGAWYTLPDEGILGRIAADGTIEEDLVAGPNDMISDVSVGADGSVWFTEMYGGRISRIDPAGHKVSVLLGGCPWRVAANPDGTAWVTDVFDILALVTIRGAGVCPGDCAETDSTSISEVIVCVGMVLGTNVKHCAACDTDGDGSVNVTDLIATVASAVGGCATLSAPIDPS